MDDKTNRLLEQFLNQSSQTFTFDYAIVDMRKMLRLLPHDRPELASILSPPELERLEQFAMPKKKLQWLSGRYAVKSALFKYKIARGRFLNLNCIDLLNRENSAPYLVQFPNLQTSITHSYPYCIGVVSERPIGIDLEKVIVLSDSLIRQFFHPNEIQNLGETNADDYHPRAITYWTRKEAVSKLLKLGLKMDFKQTDTANDFLIYNEKRASWIKLKSYQINDYCFSLAIGGERSLSNQR